MLSLLTRWYERGLLLVDPEQMHLDTLDRYHTLELTAPGFAPVYHEGEPLVVPRRVTHDNSDTHNTLDESLKFLIPGVKNLKDEECFWTSLKRVITESGAPAELLQLVTDLQARCQGLHAVVAYKQASNGVYYWVLPTGTPDPKPYPFRGKLSAETLQRTGVVHDGTTIILTYHGTPLHQIPEIRDYWQAHWKELLTSDGGAPVTVTDVITGAKGLSVRLLPPVNLGGYPAPLASFNSKAWQFDSEAQARSLPLTLRTILIINEGFESMLGRQTMRLDKLGVDDVAVSWHVVSTLEHPILPILSEVLNGGDVDRTKAAWEELRKLPDDPSTVHFVAWAAMRGRFGALDDWTVSVTRLRDSLLQYHAEWAAAFSHHPVRSILMRKRDPQPLTLQSSHHVPVFRAITLGTTFSDTLASDQTLNGIHRDERGSTQWILVGLSRKLGIKMQHPADITLREYNADSVIPRLAEFVGDFEAKLADQPDKLAAFRFGQLLAFHEKLGSNYRVIKGHRFSGTPVIKRVHNLREYFAKEIQQFLFWRHLLNERTGVSTRITLLYYDDLICKLDPTMQVTSNNVYTNAGWSRTKAYIDETVRYYQAMEGFCKPGEDPEDRPGQPTPEELKKAS